MRQKTIWYNGEDETWPYVKDNYLPSASSTHYQLVIETLHQMILSKSSSEINIIFLAPCKKLPLCLQRGISVEFIKWNVLIAYIIYLNNVAIKILYIQDQKLKTGFVFHMWAALKPTTRQSRCYVILCIRSMACHEKLTYGFRNDLTSLYTCLSGDRFLDLYCFNLYSF